MRALLPLPLAVLACASPGPDKPDAPAEPLLRVDDDGHLRDADGRQVLLRGLNARVDGLFDVSFDDGRVPLEVIPPFGPADCAFLAEELGLNLLRLPVNWSGIEPQPGEYSAAYLDRIGQLVDGCAAAGVLTVVDLHQDAYGKDIGEDGAPLWAIHPPPEVLLEGPLTSEELAERRRSPAVLQAFASLYADAPLASGRGVREAYAEMAAVLADFLAAHPGAIAIELQNEPVTGGQQALLDDFHDAVAAEVRAVAPRLPIVFEPDALRNLTDVMPVERPWSWGEGLYSPHIYTDVFEDGWASQDTGAILQSIDRAVDEAAQHGSHLFVGEFGNDPRTERGQLFIATCLEAFDAHQASWALWLYEEHSQDSWGLWDEGEEAHTRGALREEAADQLARAFPIAVDGTLADIAYAVDTHQLTLTFASAGPGLHLLSVPLRHFPDGAELTCDGQSVAGSSPQPGRLEVACAGTELRVQPRP